MLGAGDDIGVDVCPGHNLVRVEVAHAYALYEQAAQRAVNVGLAYVTTTDGLGQLPVAGATLHVGTGEHAFGGGCRSIG